jgi:hypothetical protein
LKVISSSDDEGNNFNEVIYSPSLGKYEEEDGDFISLEQFEEYEIEDNEIKRKCIKCNEYKCVNHFHEIKGKRKYYSYCKICLYEIQKNRWLDRKMEAIKLMGGPTGTGYGFDVSGVGGMKSDVFQDYMIKQNAKNLKKMRGFDFYKGQ